MKTLANIVAVAGFLIASNAFALHQGECNFPSVKCAAAGGQCMLEAMCATYVNPNPNTNLDGSIQEKCLPPNEFYNGQCLDPNQETMARAVDAASRQQFEAAAKSEEKALRQQKLNSELQACQANSSWNAASCQKNYDLCSDDKHADSPVCKTLAESGTSSPPCGDSHKAAQLACTGQQFSGAISDTIAAFTYARSTNNMKEACEQAKKALLVSAGATGGTMVMCQIEVTKCRNACSYASSASTEMLAGPYLQDCRDFDKLLQAGATQVMSDMQKVAQSQACVDAINAAGACGDTTAFTNPQCPDQYCSNPINLQAQVCVDRRNLCSQPQFSNTLTCFCQGNPSDAKCTGGAGTPIASLTTNPGIGSKAIGSIGVGTPKFDTSDDNTDPQLFGGNPAADTKAAQAAYEDNKGGGLSGGGGSFGSGGTGGGRGKAEGPYNTDIYRGVSASGGGGVSYGGGGGYAGSGGTKGSSGDGGAAVDWRKFMPKLDQKRAPANVTAEAYNAGITAANGLSNFEKITRKMNEKRGSLLP